MYKVILLFVLFTSFLFSSTIPQWYLSQNISKTNSYDIIGYGEGISKDEAVQNALVNISRQISVKIDSTVQINKSTVGGYSKGIKSNSTQQTNSSITDYEVIKSSYDQKYFVAILYENIPFYDRFLKNIKTPLKNEIKTVI